MSYLEQISFTAKIELWMNCASLDADMEKNLELVLLINADKPGRLMNGFIVRFNYADGIKNNENFILNCFYNQKFVMSAINWYLTLEALPNTKSWIKQQRTKGKWVHYCSK